MPSLTLRLISLVLLLIRPLAATETNNAEPPRPETIELIEISGAKEVLDGMKASINAMIDGQLNFSEQGIELTDEAVEIIADYKAEARATLDEMLDWKRLKFEYARIYENVMTEQEISDLLEVYRGPIGKLLLEKLPLILEQSMALGMESSQKLQPKIQATVQKYTRRLQQLHEDERLIVPPVD